MRVAVGQLGAGDDKEANLARIAEQARQAGAAGAGMVVFPEVVMAKLDDTQDAAAFAEPLGGPFVVRLGEFAAEQGLVLVAGISETIANDRKVYNTAVVLSDRGDLVGRYRKLHTFDAFGHAEARQTRAGDGELLTFDLAGIRFGLAICYDLRFPELFRELARRGCDAVVVPSAWASGHLKEDHWLTLARARAIENTVYVIAADQVGPDTVGRSVIVDPLGVALVDAGESETISVAEIDRARVATVRELVPSLSHMRPDVYARWSGSRG